MSSFSKLGDLIELSNKYSHEIILELLVKLDDWSDFLKSNLEFDYILQTVVILSKVCSSPFRRARFVILQVAVNAKFLLTLQHCVMNLKYENRQNEIENTKYWIIQIELLVNLAFLYESIIDIIPQELIDILQTLNYVESKIQYLGIIYNREERRINNFRNLSVYPTREEVLSSNYMINIIPEGKYENVEQYLEVQFRLLKTGFVEPLRQEIVKYIEDTKSGSRFSNSFLLRIYPYGFFQSIAFAYDTPGAILKFSEQKTIEEIFSSHSPSFGCGTIVCFTKDNFSSILIGRVAHKNWKNQHLVIHFDHESSCFEYNVWYTVVEYKVDFQQTYFALKALQCMSVDDFPMESYLINAVPYIERPNYLNQNSSIYTIRGRKVDVLSDNWPTPDQLQLDFTQYTAFKAALTQKFAMIQGAPGTGKTYLGLEIVKTLLHIDNGKIWYNGTPILIVCLSNQVLDTFLEGLIPTTSEIIRVGKTESKKLVHFTLNSARKRNDADCGLIDTVEKEKMEKLILKLKNGNNTLKHIKDIQNNIINVKYFKNIDNNLETSWFFSASACDYFAWLFYIQNEDADSMEISEVIQQITEETKDMASLNDRTSIDGIISPDPYGLVIYYKPTELLGIVGIRKKMQEVDIPTDEMKKLELRLKCCWRNYQYFTMTMAGREFSAAPTKPTNVNYQSPHNMDPNDRWNLYFYWLNLYKLYVEKQFHEIPTEIQNIRDVEIMKRTLILGMTISTAAKMRITLQALNCRIVVVQEASDVAECPTVLSLTKHCDHLILMGDQRVETNLSAVDNSNSFFIEGTDIMKRMMHIKVQCNTLLFQYRMRPKISQLLLSQFYPSLTSHYLVTKFPAIIGIPSPVFFVTHELPEYTIQYSITTNIYKATFLINLARYLRKVGYAPEDITILTVSSDQMHILCDERKEYAHLLEGIEICVLETYKGRESKIILLSLECNNQERTSFIWHSDQLIILALSRAREALYMMGNIELLCNNSMVWQKIENVLVKHKCIGNYLPVCCKINPKHVIKINQPEDFDRVPQECFKICRQRLHCGHACQKNCHDSGTDHKSKFCNKLC